nr:uncharacterized protein LOC129267808 [Lytechinus pictus]
MASQRQIAAVASQVMQDLLKNQEFISLLESTVGNAIEKKMGELLKSIESIQGELFELKSDAERKDKEIERCKEKITQQEQNILRLEHSVNNMEQYSRRSCLRIFGLQEKRGENTDTLVKEAVTAKLGVSLDNMKDIDRSHRTGRTPVSAQPGSSSTSGTDKPKPRPIIVKLTSYRKKREILQNRKKLKGTKIVIAEDLTMKNQKLISQTRSSKSVKTAWSSDGRIIALLGSTSSGKNITKLLTCEEDLRRIPTT